MQIIENTATPSLTLIPPPGGMPEGAVVAPMTLNLAMGQEVALQVQDHLESLGDPRGFGRVVLPPQSAGAIMALAALDTLRDRLPELGLVPMGNPATLAGWFDASDFRHNTCRGMRDATPGPLPDGFVVFDGAGRGVDDTLRAALAGELGCKPEQIRVVGVNPGQVNVVDLGGAEGRRLADQVVGALRQVEFPVGEVAGAASRLIFIPHGLGIVGAVQALTLHGVMGSWPRTVRTAPAGGGSFAFSELLDPQAMRLWAAGLIRELQDATPRVIARGALPDGARELLDQLRALGVEVRG